MEEFWAMKSVCRVCLSNGPGNQSIFSIKSEIIDESTEFWKIMRLHGGIEISTNDGLPQFICSDCTLKFLEAHVLWKQCQETDEKLREHHKKQLEIVDENYDSSQISDSLPHEPIEKENDTNDIDTKNNGIAGKISTESSKNSDNHQEEAATDETKDAITTDEEENPTKHNSDENFPNNCPICDKKFKRTYSFLKHLNFHKKQNTNEVYGILKDVRDKRGNFSSHEVSKDLRDDPLNNQKIIIKQINSWIRQELESNSERLFTCALCNQSYLSKKSLIRHQANFHKIPDSIEMIEAEENKCETCGEIFETKTKLKKHKKTHEISTSEGDFNFKRFLCHICSKTFRQKTGLTFHMRTHTGDKPFICRYCDRRFTSSSNRINHERTHTGVRPFICHFCSAAFAKSCTLKAHITTHTGEANYHCKTCGKSFRRLKYLKEHRFTHTGEKPYVCKLCGVAYSHSGSLFVHEKKCKAQSNNYASGKFCSQSNCDKNIERILGL